MSEELLLDETLVRGLPLPLAQLYRRAHNAKAPLEQHLTAFYLWEAALKLLASSAIVELARREDVRADLSERLQNLARPSLGHWWEFARLLTPVLAERHPERYGPIHELIHGKPRSDLPRAAGLDATLLDTLEGKRSGKATVRLLDLIDRLIQYRNKVIGHAALAQREEAFHRRMTRALLAGAVDVLRPLDVCARGRMVFVAEVRQVAGAWLIERYELIGENVRRLPSLERQRSETPQLPETGRVYLEVAGDPEGLELRCLHPLLLYDFDAEECLFLNARRGRQTTEYLCYTSGRTENRPDLGGEQRALFARVLGMAVSPEKAAEWAGRSKAEEPNEGTTAGDQPKAVQRHLGEFELVSELGRGGMGVVYRAWQPSLGRPVALKLLKGIGDTKAEARFAREIRALGRVEHPNLVKIFTSGVDGDQWYFAMELVEGADLAGVCARLSERSGAGGPDLDTWQAALETVCEDTRNHEKSLDAGTPAPATLPRAQRTPLTALPKRGDRSYISHAAELIRQVAVAAHSLHEAGVIHRDIKPGNIMITQDGGQAVLMDLGLAQLADDVDGRLTRTRQFVGTLRYASPQQVMAVGRLDRRSDVYSLGASLWELLTLRPLYAATDETPTPDLMEKIQREEPQRVRRLNKNVPRDLEAIAHKCLEKAPDQRYATAQELADDLQRFLNGEPVQARPVGGFERGVKWLRRHPAVAAVYGLVLLTLVLGVGGGGIAWLWRRAESARSDAEAARETALSANQRTEEALKGEKEARQLTLKSLESEQQAKSQAERALRGEQEARQGEALAKEELARVSYAHRINLVQREWQAGEVARARDILDGCDEKFRGWEWRHLNLTTHPELMVLHGHQGAVKDVAVSADGKLFASAGADKTVRLWNIQSGALLHTLDQGEPVYHVGFSDDGSLIAGSGFKSVKVWDAHAGKLLALLPREKSSSAAALHPRNTQVAVAVYQHIRASEITAGKTLFNLYGHTQPIWDLRYSGDGRILVSTGEDTVRVWDTTTGQELWSARSDYYFRQAALSPDGKLLAFCGSRDNKPVIEVRAAVSGVVVLELADTGPRMPTPGKPETRLRFGPDGRLVRLAQDRIQCWDLVKGREAGLVRGLDISAMAIHPDGKHIAFIDGAALKIWNGQETQVLQGHGGYISAIAFSADGLRLVSAGGDGAVRVWDVTGTKERLRLQRPTERLNDPLQALATFFVTTSVHQVIFSPDGQRLAAKGPKAAVVWNAVTGEQLLNLKGHNQLERIAYAPDCRTIAVAGSDGIRFFDAATGKEQNVLEKGSWVQHIVYSTDGKFLASTTGKGGGFKNVGFKNVGSVPLLWDLSTGKWQPLKGHDAGVTQLAFSPDNTLLATAGLDQAIRFWHVPSGNPVATLLGHSAAVTALAFTPDGATLLSGSNDRTIRRWDVKTATEVGKSQENAAVYKLVCVSGERWAALLANERVKVSGNGGAGLTLADAKVHDLAMTPDGERLATAGANGETKLWDTRTGKELLALPSAKGAVGVGVVVFSPDGRSLAAGISANIKIWESQYNAGAAAERRRIWQVQEYQSSCNPTRWYGAAFHAGQMLAAQPQNADLLEDRGEAYAEQQRWDEALADFAAAHKLRDDQLWQLYYHGMACLAKNDSAAAERTLDDMLAAAAQLPRVNFGHAAVKLGVVVARDRQRLDRLIAIEEAALKVQPRNAFYAETLAAACYRAGDFKRAHALLKQASDLRKPQPSLWTLYFQAMTEERLGRPYEARLLLDRALKKAGEFADPLPWHERFRLEMLRAEAEQTVLGDVFVVRTRGELRATEPRDRIFSSPCQIRTAQLQAGKTYAVSLDSDHPWLRLEDAAGKELARDSGDRSRPARIVFACPATGAYRVVMASTTAAAEPWLLSIREVVPVPVQELTLKDGKDQIAARLAATDLLDEERRTACARRFSVALQAGKVYTFTMESVWTPPEQGLRDCYLRLESASGTHVRRAGREWSPEYLQPEAFFPLIDVLKDIPTKPLDPKAPRRSSQQLRFQCGRSGTYHVVATTFVNETGPFTLSVRAESLPTATPLALDQGRAEVSASLAPNDPRNPEKDSGASKIYALALTTGNTYQIDLKFTDVFQKASLRLEDASGNKVAFTPANALSNSARLEFTCPQSGTYRLFATGMSLFDKGAFRLIVQQQ